MSDLAQPDEASSNEEPSAYEPLTLTVVGSRRRADPRRPRNHRRQDEGESSQLTSIRSWCSRRPGSPAAFDFRPLRSSESRIAGCPSGKPSMCRICSP